MFIQKCEHHSFLLIKNRFQGVGVTNYEFPLCSLKIDIFPWLKLDIG